jgi:phosphate-selective porin OprO/OprP
MKNFMTAGSIGAIALAATLTAPLAAQAQDATLNISGRLMLDYTTADINNPDVSVETAKVRRARIAAKGKYGDAISYKFEVNHSTGSDLELTDGFIQFQPKDQPFFVKVGQYKTHNSFEEETSSRFTTTIERGAYTDTFELNRRLGVSVGTKGDNYTFIAGYFNESVEGGAFDNNGKALAARATFVPYKTDETLVHLGGSWRYRDGSDSFDETENDGLRYRQRPYGGGFDSSNTNGVLSSGRIINTGRFAKSDNLYGVEGAVLHNNLWMAGEYNFLNANGADTNADGSFNGGYIEAGIVFGGRRTYKASNGTWDRPKVDNPFGSGGMGAVALVARYDVIDVQDGPYLGELDTVVLGADWMPTKQTRLRINYFDSDATNGAADSVNGVVARLGFDF